MQFLRNSTDSSHPLLPPFTFRRRPGYFMNSAGISRNSRSGRNGVESVLESLYHSASGYQKNTWEIPADQWWGGVLDPLSVLLSWILVDSLQSLPTPYTFPLGFANPSRFSPIPCQFCPLRFATVLGMKDHRMKMQDNSKKRRVTW